MRSSRGRGKCMERSDAIAVSAVYALADHQVIVRLNVPSGTTVAEVVEASGLRRRFPEIPATPSCAIYGRAVAPTDVVRSGDRVEILRPLLMDPKESRRRAAAVGRARSR